MDDEITCEVEGSRESSSRNFSSSPAVGRTGHATDRLATAYVGGMSVVTLQDAVLCRPFQC